MVLAGAVLDRISEPKGEITVVVGPANTPDSLNDQRIRLLMQWLAAVEMFGRLTNLVSLDVLPCLSGQGVLCSGPSRLRGGRSGQEVRRMTNA